MQIFFISSSLFVLWRFRRASRRSRDQDAAREHTITSQKYSLLYLLHRLFCQVFPHIRRPRFHGGFVTEKCRNRCTTRKMYLLTPSASCWHGPAGGKRRVLFCAAKVGSNTAPWHGRFYSTLLLFMRAVRILVVSVHSGLLNGPREPPRTRCLQARRLSGQISEEYGVSVET